nr:MurR/RpiR family transcriptional regulator [Marinicella sp. W31]MDC2878204.1 MurR/RpiR family transcriptional regulator [Marinicella sp. W31]
MTPEDTNIPLTERLHSLYAELPARERQIADFILESPGELALINANELAERTGVSNATVTRLFQRLGYQSFDEARRAVRELRAAGSPFYLAEKDGTKPGHGISQTLAGEMQRLEASLAMQSPLTVGAVCEAIAKAPTVRVAGFRNSYFPAAYFCTTLLSMRPNASMLNVAGQTLAETAAGLGKDDVVVIVGLRRRPAGFLNLMKTIAATGCRIVLIADRSVREAPAHATWTLYCAVETPQLLDSYSGAMAVLRLLALETMRKLGSDARHRLADIEQLHDTLKDLES